MSGSYDYDLLCIGSGPAGQRAAVQAAKLGRCAAIVEKRRMVGGLCVDRGTMPSKTFREAVLFFVGTSTQPGSTRPHHAACRPSAEQLLARVAAVVQREAEVVEDQLWRNDIDLIQGAASFKDPHTVVVASETTARTVTAANILIAVGTMPFVPDGIHVDGDVILSSDDIVHLKRIPRRMTVVGAGVIGIEYASMFGALKVEVTVIDKRERVLEFLDWEMVDDLMHQMRGRGVIFRLGEAVEQVEIAAGPPRQAVLILESGKRLVSDLVLYSTGRIGATHELNLGSVGLKADRRGRLKVDDCFRTEVHHILAAGDVIGFPSLAATSAEQGRLAACHAFGADGGPMAPHFPIGIYAIPEISMVGATEHELTKQRVPYESGTARYKEIARGQIIGDGTGLLKLLFHREDRRLLGVHAIGTGATELVHIGQAVLGLGGGLEYFLNTVFNYPTLAECYKVAALNAHNKLNLMVTRDSSA